MHSHQAYQQHAQRNSDGLTLLLLGGSQPYAISENNGILDVRMIEQRPIITAITRILRNEQPYETLEEIVEVERTEPTMFRKMYERAVQGVHTVKKGLDKLLGRDPHAKYLESIVREYNKNQSATETIETLELPEETDIKAILKESQEAYMNGRTQTKIAKYDNTIATNQMRTEIAELYTQSNEKLSTIAEQLTQKYGMNISASTVSKYGRKLTKTWSRREAKKKRVRARNATCSGKTEHRTRGTDNRTQGTDNRTQGTDNRMR